MLKHFFSTLEITFSYNKFLYLKTKNTILQDTGDYTLINYQKNYRKKN